jgi:signal transduction histidine kinase/ActR/RegA family two-component response regulator/HPt (histidine-containing phosphotransfer) domain-containing protein
MLIVSVWSLCYALNTAAATLSLKILFYKIAVTFAAFIGPATLAMALGISGYGHWLTRRAVAVLGALSGIFVLLSWTGEHHALFRYGFSLVTSGPLLLLEFKLGWAWRAYLVYINVLMIAALALFLAGALRSPAASRPRFYLLFMGTIIPMVVDGMNLTPIEGFSMTTSILWFTGSCYFLVVFRYRLLEVAPVARAALFDQLDEPILVFDDEGAPVDCNRAARKLLGLGTGASLAGLGSAALARFPLLTALTMGSRMKLDDFVQDALDKNRYWRLKSLQLKRGPLVVGTLVQFYDVSTMKRSEEELRRAHGAAEATSRAKSAFLANTSHEIRTPMNAIIGFTDLVLDTDLTPEQRTCLETVKQSSETLLSILNDIVDSSKIEAGKMELEEVDFNLRTLNGEVVQSFSLQAETKRLKLTYYIGPDVPTLLKGDPVRLKQVLLNLVGNAIKFTETGEVTITVEAARSDAGGKALHRGDRAASSVALLFCVRDTGIGIPEDKHESVFLSFTQADSSITRKYGGTGLGLSISSELVRMMGGQLKVESEVGKGSTFYFTAWFAPGREAGEPAQAAVEPQPPSRRRNMKILLVEDTAINRTLAIRLLEKRGHRVASAKNGNEALQLLEKELFDVVLMDDRMPVMDGCETARRIRDPRSSVLRHDVPIVALTALALVSDKERCLAAGMNGYLSKPLRAEELFAAVEQCDGFIPSAPSDSREQGGASLPHLSFPVLSRSGQGAEAATGTITPGKDIPAIMRAELLERHSGDETLVDELLEVFRREIPEIARKIRESLDVRDVALVQLQAHACKGAAGAVGFASLAELAHAIEYAAEAGDIESAGIHFMKLEQELHRFLNP